MKPFIETYLGELSPENYPNYCSKYLKIQTKSKGLISLELNPPQLRLWKERMRLAKEGKPVWLLLLKARQQGFSTETEAFCYQQTTTNKDYRSLIIAHEGEAADRLYKMFKIYYDCFPSALRPRRKSPGNRKGLEFDLLRSSIRVFTAGNPLATSGGTFQFLHISELAKWNNAEEAMLSLLQTVPNEACVTVESTAYGTGNHFHQMWIDACNGRNNFTPLFFPWHENPEYGIELADGEKMEPESDDRNFYHWKQEMYYVDRFKLTPEQHKFMRWVRKNKCGNDWRNFQQEYPSYPEEAFLSTGRSVFDTQALVERELAIRKLPPKVTRGMLTLDEFKNKDGNPRVAAKFIEGNYGDLEIYGTLPDPDDNWAYRYIIGADICEGLDANAHMDGKRTLDPDYNVVSVWDRIESCQKAFLRNRDDPDVIGRKIFALMLLLGGNLEKAYYPMAIVERNNPGLATILYLRDLLNKYTIPLGRMFHRGTMDRDYVPPTDLLGFRTMQDTKAVLVGEVARRIREAQDGIQSMVTVEEAKTFINDGKRYRAQDGCHDDAVMGLALSYYGHDKEYAPFRVKKVVKLTGWRAEMFKKPTRTFGYWDARSFTR